MVKKIKSKKFLFVLFLTIFINLCLINFKINPASAYETTYEQRTDPVTPFTFIVDKVYTTSSGTVSYSGTGTNYHNVSLNKDNYYLFYCASGPALYDWANLKVYCTSPVESISNYNMGEVKVGKIFLLLIIPPYTAIYNITISFSGVSAVNPELDGIGVLKVPEIDLDKEVKSDDWSFKAEPVTAALIDLEPGDYQYGSTGSAGKCRYFKISSSLVQTNLDESYLNMLEVDNSHITIEKAGKYLFYMLDGGPIKIQEYGIVIHSYPIYAIGLVSLISIIIIIWKKKGKY